MFHKLRFYRNEGQEIEDTTAGLVVDTDTLKGSTIGELSRLFPMSESNKMYKIQASKGFETFVEAFAHKF